ncbi:MAG TPA: hypothetical protein VFV87_17695 [Pirellulaceae bacterium]|nr:hypothetical protein [Pirellulaceae bacterium]
MSRSESPRDDVFAEAKALVERAELTIPGHADSIVVGFRRDGSASFFFGGDPVYHFNTAGELRRAYIGDLLYKAEHGRLIALRRERSAWVTALVRHELTPAETVSILSAMRQRLLQLLDALNGNDAALLRQAPSDVDLAGRLRDWLSQMPAVIEVARVAGLR